MPGRPPGEKVALVRELKHQRGILPLCLVLNAQVAEQVSEHRHLGVVLDDHVCSLVLGGGGGVLF